MRLLQLTKHVKKAIVEDNLLNKLCQNPQLVLPMRLVLNLTQRKFVQLTNISQNTVIKYERNRAKSMNKKNAETIFNLFSKRKSNVNYQKILRTYNKFKSMQKGKHMTSKRAKELQKIWQQKTTREQKSLWGRKGAEITNKKQRLTIQEKKIIELLERGNLVYKSHYEIPLEKKKINVDFALFKNENLNVIIEVSDRKSNLYEYSLACCYKAYLLRQKYSKIKLLFVSSNQLTPSSKELLENEFDYVLKMSEASRILHLIQ